MHLPSRHSAAVFFTATSLVVSSCGGADRPPDDPFANAARTVPPPPATQIIFTSNLYSTQPGAGRDGYSVAVDGASLTRLTFCNEATMSCDNAHIAPAFDRARSVALRLADSNGDGRFTDDDTASLVFLDLARGVQAPLVQGGTAFSGVDWTGDASFIIFSARGVNDMDDLFTANGKGERESVRNVTGTMSLGERRPRLRFDGNAAVFERIAEGTPAAILIISVGPPTAVTQKVPGGDLLAGTPYRVGSDADPVFSPDGRSVAFRRLTSTTADGRGEWDILTASTDGSGVRLVASGPAFRGSPDWGSAGIVFPETDQASARLVVVGPDGSNRRVPVTAPASVSLSSPRWLAEPR